MVYLCTGLLFTLEYEDELGDIYWLKVNKVTSGFRCGLLTIK